MSRVRPLLLAATVFGLLALAPAALADNITTDAAPSDVTATVGAEIAISVTDPDTLTLSHLTPPSAWATIAVVSTQPGWTVSVKDLDEVSPGQLDRSSGSGPTTLSEVLSLTPFGAETLSLTASNQNVLSGQLNDSGQVQFAQTLADGEDVLAGDTYASTVEYSVVAGEQGNGGGSPPPDPIANVTTDSIPNESGTIYFQRTQTPIDRWHQGGYPIAVGSVGADGAGFTASSWLTGFTDIVSVGFTASYNAQTLLTMPNNTSLLTWAAPDGSNLHQDFDAAAACQSISGNFTSNWDSVEVSPSGDAIRIYCDGDKFVNVNASSGAVSEWTSPWDGQYISGSGYLPWGQSWKLSPDGTKRVGTPTVLVNTDNGAQYVQNGVWTVPDGGTPPYAASGTQIVAPFSNDPYDSEWGATWSRDGSQVGWFRLDDSAGKYYVMVADADGDNQVSIETPTAWGNYLVFSPDGQWVVYSVGTPSTGIGLEAVKTDGTGSPVTLASAVQGVRLEPLAWTGSGESFASFQN